MMGHTIEDLNGIIDGMGYTAYNPLGEKARDFTHNEYILLSKELMSLFKEQREK